MPCSGPSQEAAYARADEAFPEIAAFLKERYGVDVFEESYWPGLRETAPKDLEALKAALREVFWNQACNDW